MFTYKDGNLTVEKFRFSFTSALPQCHHEELEENLQHCGLLRNMRHAFLGRFFDGVTVVREFHGDNATLSY